MYIDPKYIIGKKFFALDPNIEYECAGYSDNGTLLVIGFSFDAPNNRTNYKTFKLTEVKFVGRPLVV